METTLMLGKIFFHPLTIISGVFVGWATLLIFDFYFAHSNRAVSRNNVARSNDDRFWCSFAEALHNSEYVGTAGGVIYNFYDADLLVMREFGLLDSLAQRIVEKLNNNFPNAKVCFMEGDSGPVGMIPLQGLVAKLLNKSTSVIRLRRDILKMAVKGASIESGDEVVILQDVFRTGFHVIKANRILSSMGARIVGIVALVDRVQERDRDFSALNIRVESLRSLSDIQESYEKIKPTEKNIESVG